MRRPKKKIAFSDPNKVREAVAYMKHNAIIKKVKTPEDGYRVYYGGQYRHQMFVKSWDGAIHALKGYYIRHWRGLSEAAVEAEMRRQFGEKNDRDKEKQAGDI